MVSFKRTVLASLLMCALPAHVLGQPTQPEASDSEARDKLRQRAEQALAELDGAEEALAAQLGREPEEKLTATPPFSDGPENPDGLSDFPDDHIAPSIQAQDIDVELENQQPDVTVLGDYPDADPASELALAKVRLAEAQRRYEVVIAQLNAATWAAMYRAALVERLAERRRLRRLRRLRYRRSLAPYYRPSRSGVLRVHRKQRYRRYRTQRAYRRATRRGASVGHKARLERSRKFRRDRRALARTARHQRRTARQQQRTARQQRRTAQQQRRTARQQRRHVRQQRRTVRDSMRIHQAESAKMQRRERRERALGQRINRDKDLKLARTDVNRDVNLSRKVHQAGRAQQKRQTRRDRALVRQLGKKRVSSRRKRPNRAQRRRARRGAQRS